MVQERMTILRLLEEGKITLDEASDLLEVIEQPDRSEATSLGELRAPQPSEETPAAPSPTDTDEAAFSGLDLAKLTEMRIHGVTPRVCRRVAPVGCPWPFRGQTGHDANPWRQAGLHT